jgi:hypothetical protein
MADVNAGRSRTVRAPDNEDATIGIMEQEPQRSSHDNAQELRLSQPSILEVFHNYQLYSYHN